jgi:hypothetical protein
MPAFSVSRGAQLHHLDARDPGRILFMRAGANSLTMNQFAG